MSSDDDCFNKVINEYIQARQLTPIIPATWEAIGRRIIVQGQSEAKM
jgi:hypothetical protein